MKKSLFLVVLLLAITSLVFSQDPTANRIKPVPEATLIEVGQEFDVLIRINTGTAAVYAASFILDYGDTYPVDVVSVLPGDFLGVDLLFNYIINEAQSDVHISISQKGAASGVVGIGTLATVRFHANDAANMDVRTVTLNCNDLDIRNPNAQLLPIFNTSGVVTIAEAFVWPGDLDNNGTVNETDVLQIGLRFNETGPSRSNASFAWQAQPAALWTDVTAVYVDATGDGRIKINDMPPIGFNYGMTHSEAMPKTSPVITPLSVTNGNQLYATASVIGDQVTISVMAEAQDLFGISFKAFYNPSELSFIDATNGEYLPSGIFFKHVDTNKGLLASAVTLTKGESGLTDTKSVMVARFTLLGSNINLHFQDVTAYNTLGDLIGFQVRDLSEVTSVDEPALPTAYSLGQNYPNPFNPTTTISFVIANEHNNVIASEAKQSLWVTLKVYNLLGQEVATLVNEVKTPGTYTVPVDASQLTDGVYFYTLRAGTFLETKKMLLIK